ncbi:MAG: ABC transporter ATP-binding protein [Aggregatilineales bacterium]
MADMEIEDAEDVNDDALLVVNEVFYRYGSATALTNVSFSLDKGQLVALVGRNGAGKSTLLRCLAAWAGIERGDIIIDRVRTSLNERAAREKTMLIPDTPPFYDELTAWEHLQFIAQLHHITNWKLNAEVLLHDFDLWESHNASPTTFSRGMRYKLAVCMAFLVNPSLLLMDEPFGPLDPNAAEVLWNALRERTKNGMTVLFSSHALPTDDQPDSYLIIDQGKIITHGTAETVTGSTDSTAWSLNAILRAALDE